MATRVRMDDDNPKTLSFEYEENELKFNDNFDMFSIIAKTPDGIKKAYSAKDFSEQTSSKHGTGRTITYRNTFHNWNGHIKVSITFSPKAAEVRAGLTIENSTELEIQQVHFPKVPIYKATNKHKLLMPSPWGDLIENPVDFLRQKKHNEKISFRYPAQLAMQYMTIFDNKTCVYLSGYNMGAESFDLSCSLKDKDSLIMACEWHPFLNNGSWTMPQTGIAIFNGDWHIAARHYISAFGKRYKPAALPTWMKKDFHGWVQVKLKTEGQKPKYKFKDLPNIFKSVKEVGINVLHVYGWSGIGFDTAYPEYNINPDLGSEQELREALSEVKKMGGRVILYMNGRLIDPNTQYYARSGKNDICLNEEGNPYEEEYGTSVTFRIACPSAPGYRQQMQSELKKMITEWGCQAIQVDQVSCCPGNFCFSTTHEHPSPSTNFLKGLDKMMRGLSRTYRTLDAGFFCWAEGIHERFGQFYEVNQGHGEELTWTNGTSLPEQFKFTYPKYLITGISDEIPKLCFTFGQGKPFDFHLENLENKDYKKMATDFVAIRKAYPNYFLSGKFIDNQGANITMALYGDTGLFLKIIIREC